VPDASEIEFYRVYFSDSLETEFRLLDETQQTSYIASNLQNGMQYDFRVSSVSQAGFEGYPSLTVSATPNLYSIIINNGSEFTDGRDITLALTAPVGSLYMQISNYPLFPEAYWESFSSTRSWQLPSGDGDHNVYARFRDADDNTTAGYFFDTITLDTRAAIDSVTFSPVGQQFRAGDVVNFRLYGNELDGQSRITVGQNLVSIDLYDDGSEGDVVPDDGIYGADFEINNSLDFENAAVMGSFTDPAGNTADQARCRDNISVRRAPDPVSIYSVNSDYGRHDRLLVSWTPSSAGDFAQYNLYRSNSANIDSTDLLVRSLTSAQPSSLTDTGLSQNTAYYYRVYVVDNTGLWSGSNEMSGTTAWDSPPEPAAILPILVAPDEYEDIRVFWNQAQTNDFNEYRVYTWREDQGRDDSLLLAVIPAQDSTAYHHEPEFPSGIDTVNYWYVVQTYDFGGNSAASNAMRVHIADNPPEQVYGAVIPDSSFLTISWIPTEIPDFGSYRLLRDTLSNPGGATIILLSHNRETSSFNDMNTDEGRVYFYWLDIYDRRSHSSRTFMGSSNW
jgi:fibronectin type 3 domain-containing protein